MKSPLLIFVLIAVGCKLSAQDDGVSSKALAASVILDSVVITATQSGFDVADFIELVRTDTSLHAAFSNLRRANCEFDSRMEFRDQKGRLNGGMTGHYVQRFSNNCRELIERKEDVFGDYYKGRKQKNRYYTSMLYEAVFITEGVVCYGDAPSPPEGSADVKSGHIEELKKLIFSPGTKADIPLIGHKTELFSRDMAGYYDFLITSDTIAGVPVYIFEARVNEAYVRKEGKTVIKQLRTTFEKQNFQVISRDYRLAHNTALYMFDVTMHIDMTTSEGKYYPSLVRYSGTWNVPMHRRETGMFEITFHEYSN